MTRRIWDMKSVVTRLPVISAFILTANFHLVIMPGLRRHEHLSRDMWQGVLVEPTASLEHSFPPRK